MEIGSFYEYKGDSKFNFFVYGSVYKLVSISSNGDIRPNEHVTCCFQNYKGEAFCLREMKCVMDSCFVISCMMECNWRSNEEKKEQNRHACLGNPSITPGSCTASVNPGMTATGHPISNKNGVTKNPAEAGIDKNTPKEFPDMNLGLDGRAADDDGEFPGIKVNTAYGVSGISGEHLRQDWQCRPREDKVSHPSHYMWLKDLCGVEPIDIARHMGFNTGNALKYILRAGHKSEDGYANWEKAIEDLRKAAFYINDEIRRIELWHG